MYYIVYTIFYLFSLLPWRVLYFMGDLIYVLVYYCFGYRKKVVFANLQLAFPEKTPAELKRIAKQFYHNFVDTFMETIKLISISKTSFKKRYKSNIEVMNALYATGQNVQLVSAHYFNWEVANLGVSLDCQYPFLGVYMPLANKIFDRIIYQMRAKFGSILVPANEFKNSFQQYAKNRYVLALIADQNPGKPEKAYWTNFFSQPTPFVKGPERGAKINDTAIVYIHFYKVKRGYYQFDFEVITTTPKQYADGELTKILAAKTEACIRNQPANYLWSHRRWKWKYDEQLYGHLMIW